MKFFLLALALSSSLAHAQTRDLDQTHEDKRAHRFVGSWLIGAATLTVPTLLGHAAQPGCSRGFCSTSVWPLALGTTVGLGLFGVGATLPHAGWGGQAGAGFGLLGGVAGFTLGLGVLNLANISDSRWVERQSVVSAGFLIGLASFGAALGLQWRDDALTQGAVAWRSGRAWLTGVTFWLGGWAAGLLVAGLTAGLSLPAPATVTMSVVFATGIGAAAFGVHRAMKGHGDWWALPVGLLAGGAAATLLGTFLYYAYVPSSRSGGLLGSEMALPMGLILTSVAAVGPIVALEWSSAVNTPEEESIPFPSSAPARNTVKVELFPAGLGVAGRF